MCVKGVYVCTCVCMCDVCVWRMRGSNYSYILVSVSRVNLGNVVVSNVVTGYLE